ncbi:MAG: 2,3,4,5-tetrahydropyridine-2,6-dicarboxylate N-succinyltransferase [Pseudomonadota bacterium]
MSTLYCFGLGVGTQNSQSQWLEVYYQQPVFRPSASLSACIMQFASAADTAPDIPLSTQQLGDLAQALQTSGEEDQAALASQLSTSQAPTVLSMFAEDTAPTSVPGAYLKLHLLSHRLVKPHETDLSGVFGTLPNVAWTNQGAIDVNELGQRQLEARLKGETLSVDCVDKFPKMTNYVVPAGVRIAHTARVRLGAYIGEGTTVMHEGFVNFNAGTLGTSMIEGRISAGVVIGEGSDLGGGCSTMGTLSGGGNIIISVGKECLIGANAGIGIPLGDRCTVESGLYITAGTKVNLLDDRHQTVQSLKARDLAGQSDLLFRRNSLTGVVECKTNKSAVALNEELHANN